MSKVLSQIGGITAVVNKSSGEVVIGKKIGRTAYFSTPHALTAINL
jgi:hypothetical protein